MISARITNRYIAGPVDSGLAAASVAMCESFIGAEVTLSPFITRQIIFEKSSAPRGAMRILLLPRNQERAQANRCRCVRERTVTSSLWVQDRILSTAEHAHDPPSKYPVSHAIADLQVHTAVF